MASLSFKNTLDTPQLTLLQSLGQAAYTHGTKLWAVGGLVRDVILGRPVLDIDLVSEAPADQLGRILISTLGGTVSSLTPFATVKMSIQGQHFDLATTRSETYKHSGTLPVITPSTLDTDLGRRDFTINALAASLDPADFGSIVDPYGGQADLDTGIIRILHPRSFQDDPTRIFRAVRYSVRLGFKIERITSGAIQSNHSLIKHLSGTRIRHEIERILGEPKGAATLLTSHHYGLLSPIHVAFRNHMLGSALRYAARRNLQGLELLAALMYPLSKSDVPVLAERLNLTRQQSVLAQMTVHTREAESQLSGAAPSVVELILGNPSLATAAPMAALSAIAAISPSTLVRRSLQNYIRRSKLAVRHLDAQALTRIGVPPGPPIGQAMRALHSAQLDRRVRSREGAIRFIRHWLKEN